MAKGKQVPVLQEIWSIRELEKEIESSGYETNPVRTGVDGSGYCAQNKMGNLLSQSSSCKLCPRIGPR